MTKQAIGGIMLNFQKAKQVIRKLLSLCMKVRYGMRACQTEKQRRKITAASTVAVCGCGV
jgi:hypothetical protein